MPLYEYECESCGRRFERIQKFSDPLVTVCEVCGGTVRKLPSSPAFHLKGSGWYATDYARKPEAKSEGKSEGDSGKTESSKPKEGTGADAPTSSEPAPKPAESSSKKESKES